MTRTPAGAAVLRAERLYRFFHAGGEETLACLLYTSDAADE